MAYTHKTLDPLKENDQRIYHFIKGAIFPQSYTGWNMNRRLAFDDIRNWEERITSSTETIYYSFCFYYMSAGGAIIGSVTALVTIYVGAPEMSMEITLGPCYKTNGSEPVYTSEQMEERICFNKDIPEYVKLMLIDRL